MSTATSFVGHTSRHSVLDVALKAAELGLAPIPVKEDGSKAPLAWRRGEDNLPTWKPTENQTFSVGWIRKTFGQRSGIGLATGVGELECFEFDDAGTYNRFLETAKATGLGDLVDKIRSGYEETTPGEGVHWFYYCEELRGNEKLAERPDPTDRHKRDVLIETRGHGGFIIIAPSNGKIHPSGGAYRLRSGKLEAIERITPEEREDLSTLAKTLDDMPEEEHRQAATSNRQKTTDGSISPGDDYQAKHTWEDILEPLGWVKEHSRGDVTYWRRPGKDRGPSATTGHCKGLHVFTSSTSFEPGRTYSKFGAYAHLHHGGNLSEAAKELSRSGYGMRVDGRGEVHQNPRPETKGPTNTTQASSAKPLSRGQTEAEQEKKTETLLAIYKPKTFGTIGKAIGELKHLWENWLVLGNLSMIWSKPKVGKTRVYIAIIKHLWFQIVWPDGKANNWPVGTKTLVLPYDRNHAEIANEMRLAGIPDEAAVCPYDPRDESGISLLSLTDPLMMRILDKTLADDPSILLIVVDTLTYASDKSLSKPEDMKAVLDGIMILAQKQNRAVLLLIHENREGGALGIRITERARVLIKLERYNESDHSRLRMYVKDSNFPKKPALTVTHTDEGITFERDKGEVGKVADRRDECARWLVEYFWKKGVRFEVDYGTLINAAGEAGFAGTLDPSENRWSDRKLLSRAIAGINDEVPALSDLHQFKIRRREEKRINRTRDLILFRLEAEGYVPSDTGETMHHYMQ
jgi:hypothetical protein